MKEKKAHSKKNNKTLAWEALEFEYVEKSVDWYWVVGFIGALVAGASLYLGNWSFAILAVLSTLVLIYLSRRQPRLIQVKLNNKTISLNERVYYLKKFDTYNIDEERSHLILHAKTTYRPITMVPLPPNAPSNKIIEILEDERGMEVDMELREPLLEIILHRWGF